MKLLKFILNFFCASILTVILAVVPILPLFIAEGRRLYFDDSSALFLIAALCVGTVMSFFAVRIIAGFFNGGWKIYAETILFLVLFLAAIFFSLAPYVICNFFAAVLGALLLKRFNYGKAALWVFVFIFFGLFYAVHEDCPACKFPKKSAQFFAAEFAKVSAQNSMSFEIYAQAEKASRNGNAAYGNLAVFQMLSIVFFGLDESAKSEFSARLTAFKDDSVVIETSQYLRDKYSNSSNLKFGNSLWISERVSVGDDYKKLLKDSFGTEIFSAQDFGAQFSAWLKNIFGGKNFSADVNLDGDVYIAGASMFAAKWSEPFDSVETRKGRFRVSETDVVDVPFMRREFSNIKYARSVCGFDAVMLDYKGGELAMIAVLPARRGGAKKPIDAFEFADYGEVFKSLASEDSRRKEVRVALPKFHISANKISLKKIFENMGLSELFDRQNVYSAAPNAQKIKLCAMDCITEIETDESGTRAYSIAVASYALASPPAFIADEPFKFFIVDKRNGYILFMGTVADPSKN